MKKRKGIEAQKVKHSTPSLAIDALIGDEEQNRRREQKERNRERVPIQVTLDHLVASYDTQGSFGEPIF